MARQRNLCQPKLNACKMVDCPRSAGSQADGRLRSVIEIRRELRDVGDALVERFVAEARAARLSWADIGQLSGTSEQAAQKRYGADGNRGPLAGMLGACGPLRP